MAVYSDIQTLLYDQLRAIADLPDIQDENENYEADENTLYLSTHFFPNAAQNRALGSNAPVFESGFFQINVIGVKGAGSGLVYEWVDTIVAQFSRGTTLTSSAISINLRIVRTYPNPGFYNSEGRYVVPIDVEFWGFDFNV